MPYWTTDIGGYWGHNVDWTTSANNELFTRWFQYGAFNPIFRIHGGGARELYGNQLERHDQGQSPQDRQSALSPDALHLFVGLEE